MYKYWRAQLKIMWNCGFEFRKNDVSTQEDSWYTIWQDQNQKNYEVSWSIIPKSEISYCLRFLSY